MGQLGEVVENMADRDFNVRASQGAVFPTYNIEEEPRAGRVLCAETTQRSAPSSTPVGSPTKGKWAPCAWSTNR